MCQIYKKVSVELNDGTNLVPENLRWIADGPNEYVPTFCAYMINGVNFATKERDDVRAVQCSGVSLVAQAMQVTSAKDKKPITASMNFYGVIKQIWELDYYHLRVPIFNCDWVKNDKGIKANNLRYTLVNNLNRIGHMEDSFVLGTDVKKVCCIDDSDKDEWSIVFRCPDVDYNVYGSDDEDDELSTVLVSQEVDAQMPDICNVDEDERAKYKGDEDEMLDAAV